MAAAGQGGECRRPRPAQPQTEAGMKEANHERSQEFVLPVSTITNKKALYDTVGWRWTWLLLMAVVTQVRNTQVIPNKPQKGWAAKPACS